MTDEQLALELLKIRCRNEKVSVQEVVNWYYWVLDIVKKHNKEDTK